MRLFWEKSGVMFSRLPRSRARTICRPDSSGGWTLASYVGRGSAGPLPTKFASQRTPAGGHGARRKSDARRKVPENGLSGWVSIGWGKEMRSVKKTSSSVLTSDPGLAYKPAIETAPPVSGASSALPCDAGADVRMTGRVPVGIW
jgi:hypothetical protein